MQVPLRQRPAVRMIVANHTCSELLNLADHLNFLHSFCCQNGKKETVLLRVGRSILFRV